MGAWGAIHPTLRANHMGVSPYIVHVCLESVLREDIEVRGRGGSLSWSGLHYNLFNLTYMFAIGHT